MGVHLAHLRLRDFRNVAKLDQDFPPGFHLLLGDNAQGKTNLLEAIYLIATLRSFRGVGGRHLIRYGQAAYFVSGEILGRASHTARLYWSPQERKISLDHNAVRRLTDYLGCLRAVVFCTEDLQLVKGTARIRRRFLDLLLSQTHPAYLALLQRYTHVLRARNALLKAAVVDDDVLAGFNRDLVDAGGQIMHLRAALLPRLSPLARLAYRRISHAAEELRLQYLPNVKTDFAVALAQSRERERQYRTTLIGPHRDDMGLLIDDRPAAPFASEGQKRTVAVVLKMAQAEYLTGIHGGPPVLLIDDVMGELDQKRRGGLLPLLERSHEAQGQIFMTCSQENWPRELGGQLTRWRISSGRIQPAPNP